MSEKRVISTPSLFKVDETFDDPRFMKVRINMMTTGVNRNGSSFSLDVVRAAEDTFKNIPVLANVIETEDEEGNVVLDYGSHDMHVENDAFNDGEQRIIYDEQVVGLVPETNNFEIVKNDETGEYNVFCDALLLRDYGNYVCDILENRDGMTDVSMEIFCDDLSYSEENGAIVVGKMMASGVTLLGADVNPAMPGAHAEIFSSKENDRTAQLASIMQELKKSLDNYMAFTANNNSKEGGQKMKFSDEKLNELLEKYAVKSEDLTFDLEAIESDEALEEAFEAQFSNPSAEPETESGPETELATDEYVVKMSVQIGENIKEFARSLSDVIYALTDLVNATYAEDGDYYGCEVFDNGTAKSKYLIMQGWYSGKAYKQSWSLKDGEYTLKGEREEVFAEWLTASEREQLESIRSNYAVMSADLMSAKELIAKYEAEPQKLELLNSKDYEQVAETAEFAELMKKETYFDLSIDDVKKKADEILLAAAKAGKIEFSKVQPEEQPATSSKPLMPFSNTKKRYGSLLDNVD